MLFSRMITEVDIIALETPHESFGIQTNEGHMAPTGGSSEGEKRLGMIYTQKLGHPKLCELRENITTSNEQPSKAYWQMIHINFRATETRHCAKLPPNH